MGDIAANEVFLAGLRGRFEKLEARIAALEGKDAEDGCTYEFHPFVDMDEVRAAIQQGTPESTGSGLCPKCGCNTSRTDDKKQFECIGCGHVWTCEAAGDGPHHRFEKLETEEDWQNAMVDPFGERAK